MDELQALRMSVMWPVVVGAAGFLLARAVFWFSAARLGRDQAVACTIVGVAGAFVAWAIAVAWDNGPQFWVAFTAGMLALAVILLVTVVQLVVEMWRHE